MIRNVWSPIVRRRNAGLAPSTPIERLAWSFPTLRGARGVVPWDPELLDAWACGPVPSSAGFHAACFVLNVWNMHAEWSCDRFDAVRAMAGVFDREHREAALAWMEDPWTA